MNVDPASILLVEDDPNDIELIHLALEDYHFVNHIHVVTDGEQALHYLHAHEAEQFLNPLPHLILLDLKLPKINGIQVLQSIRAHPRTRELIVVAMTSSAESRDLNDCYALGINSYITKPLDFQQFIDVTRQVGLYWILLNQIPQGE